MAYPLYYCATHFIDLCTTHITISIGSGAFGRPFICRWVTIIRIVSGVYRGTIAPICLTWSWISSFMSISRIRIKKIFDRMIVWVTVEMIISIIDVYVRTIFWIGWFGCSFHGYWFALLDTILLSIMKISNVQYVNIDQIYGIENTCFFLRKTRMKVVNHNI